MVLTVFDPIHKVIKFEGSLGVQVQKIGWDAGGLQEGFGIHGVQFRAFLGKVIIVIFHNNYIFKDMT